VRTPAVEAAARGVNTHRQADTPDAARPARNPPARLADPLPNVSAILLESNRRLATVAGGQIVGVGDMLGRRQVVAIDQRSVLLREPSGVQIRVGFGGRLIGVEGRID
jgi:hypothetical protein